MTIVSLEGEVLDMGDLEYIQDKVIAGDYFQVSGDINALNDTIEFIPASGKTAFLIEAKITITVATAPAGGATTTTAMVKAALKIDSVVKDNAITGFSSAGAGIFSGSGVGGAGSGYSFTDGRFNVLGLSLVGDSAKKIEIENILDSSSAFATMSGYLVDT